MLKRPLFLVPVRAGFPSPADDYLEGRLDLFEDRDRERSSRLMRLLDRLNTEMGAGTLGYAAEGYVKRWRTRFERRSPASTTNWRDLPVAKAAEPLRCAGATR